MVAELVPIAFEEVVEDLPGAVDAKSLVYGTARLFGDSVDSPVEVAVNYILEDLPRAVDTQGIVYGTAHRFACSVDNPVEVAVGKVAENLPGAVDTESFADGFAEAISFADGSGTYGRSSSTDGRSADGRFGSVGRVHRILIYAVRNLLGVAVVMGVVFLILR